MDQNHQVLFLLLVHTNIKTSPSLGKSQVKRLFSVNELNLVKIN